MQKVITQNMGEVILFSEFAFRNMQESLKFKTDVFEAQDGTEQRNALRETAQTVYRTTIAQHGFNKQALHNVLWGNLRANNWAVPVGHESQSIGHTTAKFIACRTDIFSFSLNGLALVFNDTDMQLVDIENVTNDGLFIKQSIDVDLAFVCPVRVCYVASDITNKINFSKHEATLDFTVLDHVFVPEKIPDRYLGRDIYFDALLLESGTLNTTFSQQQNLVDFDLGNVYQGTNWALPRTLKPMRKVVHNQEKLYQLRQFLYRRRGKLRDFWLPTFEQNFRLSSEQSLTNTLPVFIDEYLSSAKPRKYIAIEAQGKWSAHVITSVTKLDQTRMQLQIDPALNCHSNDVTMISYLGICRFDADAIEIKHKGAFNAEMTVNIIEIGVNHADIPI